MTSRRGRLRGTGCLVLLLLTAAVVWLAREPIGDWMGRFEILGSPEPSEALARRAEEKLDLVAREGLHGELRLSEAELQSLLTYRSGPILPAGVEDPRIDVQDSIIVLSARLRPAEIEGLPTPEAIEGTLSDTSRLITGILPEMGAPGEVLVRVRSLQIGEFVIPPFMLPAVVGGLGAQGLRTSGGAVVVPVIRDVGDIRIEGDDLVLDAIPPPASAAP